VGVTTGRKENVCVDEAASVMSLAESLQSPVERLGVPHRATATIWELLPSFDAASVDALLH
jgi:hypothetical protein